MKNEVPVNKWLKLIGKDRLQTFQDLFSLNCNLSMCFLDADAVPLTVWSKDSLFCHVVQKNNLQRCTECGLAALAAVKAEKQTRIYTCPYGLTCVLAPIFLNGTLTGYAYLGACVLSDSKITPQLREKYHLAEHTREELQIIASLLDSVINLLNIDYNNINTKTDGLKPGGKMRDERISTREQEIVELICQGFTNKQIAETLFISETTVKTHVSNILAKLNLHDRMQIIVHFYGKAKAGGSDTQP